MDCFNFKHVNEEELMTVVKRVQRDKRRKKENDEWASFLSQKKKKSFPNIVDEDKSISEKIEVHNVYRENIHCLNNLPSEHRINPRKEISNHHMQPTFIENSNLSDYQYCERIRTLIRKLQTLRQKLSTTLDALVTQNEQDLLKKKIFKDTKHKFKETTNTKRLMNCQYQLQKMDYQLVTDMRKLSLFVTGHDILPLLKVLCENHQTAWRMFQIFVRGLPDILEIDKDKEQLYELLKCVITLSRICKFIGIEHYDIINLNDFLVDDLNKKCRSILHAMNKRRIKGTQECLKKKIRSYTELSTNDNFCMPRQAYETKTNRIQMSSTDTINVSMNKFKKLAKQVFGDEEKGKKNTKKSDSVLTKDCNPLRTIDSYKVKIKNGNEVGDQDSVNKITKNKDIKSNSNSNKDAKIDSDLNCVSVGTQCTPLIENNLENFDIERFSKKLYSAVETEIQNNLHDIFRKLSIDQLHFKDNKNNDVQNEEKLTYDSEDSIASFKKLKDVFQITEIEDLSQTSHQNEDERNLRKDTEPLKLDHTIIKKKEIIRKQHVEIGSLLTEHEKDIEEDTTQEKEKNHGSRYCSYLPITQENSSYEHDNEHPFLQENQTDFKRYIKHTYSRNNSSISEDKPLNKGNNTMCSDFVPKPWDAIGSISDKLIDECLNGISSEIDNFLVKKMFDLEFA